MKYLALLALTVAVTACSDRATDNDTVAASNIAGGTNADTTTYEGNPGIDTKVMAALDTCKKVEPTCGNGNPAGYLVFPDVTSVALGVGGAGGEGALVQNGRVTGYYKMGKGSVGLQAGVSAASYVLKVNDAAALQQYQQDGEWSIGADAGVTIVQAGATAAGESSDKAQLYVFNSEGLMGDVSLNGMRIWPTNKAEVGNNAT